jgi:hypothetical protein
MKLFWCERRENLLLYRVSGIDDLTNCADSGVADSACAGVAARSAWGLGFDIEVCRASDVLSMVRENLSQKKTLLAEGLSRSVALNISIPPFGFMIS